MASVCGALLVCVHGDAGAGACAAPPAKDASTKQLTCLPPPAGPALGAALPAPPQHRCSPGGPAPAAAQPSGRPAGRGRAGKGQQGCVRSSLLAAMASARRKQACCGLAQAVWQGRHVVRNPQQGAEQGPHAPPASPVTLTFRAASVSSRARWQLARRAHTAGVLLSGCSASSLQGGSKGAACGRTGVGWGMKGRG